MSGQAVVTINEDQWNVWVASTYTELTTGLSGVASLAAGTGMLFILGAKRQVTVDTSKMLFPLDIIFISDNIIIDVASNIQPGYLVTEETPSDMFLEVNAGEAAGVDAGDTVSVEQLFTILDNVTPVISFAIPLAALGFVSAMVGGMAGLMGGSSSSPKHLLERIAEREPYTIYPWLYDKFGGKKLADAPWEERYKVAQRIVARLDLQYNIPAVAQKHGTVEIPIDYYRANRDRVVDALDDITGIKHRRPWAPGGLSKHHSPLYTGEWAGYFIEARGPITWEDIDPKIKPVVKLLVDRGYQTLESCQGGPGHDPSGPYISVDGRVGEEVSHILEDAGYPVRTWIYQQYGDWTPKHGLELRWRTVLFLEPLADSEKTEHRSMWLTPEQRKELEGKYGSVAVRWAEEATKPGDVKAAERAAEYYYKKIREAFGLGHLSAELTEEQIRKLRETLGLPKEVPPREKGYIE